MAVNKVGIPWNVALDRRIVNMGGVYQPEEDIYIKRFMDGLSVKVDPSAVQNDRIEKKDSIASGARNVSGTLVSQKAINWERRFIDDREKGSYFILNQKENKLLPGKISKNGRGSILLVCFFVLFLLSMFALTVGYMMRQKLQVIIRLDTRQKLRFMGEAGVRKSIYVLLKYRKNSKSFDALNQSWSQNESEFKEVKLGDGYYSVSHQVKSYNSKTKNIEMEQRYGFLDEESKININQMKSPEILRRLFMEVAEMSPKDADDLVRAIDYWKSKNNNAFGTSGDGYYADLKPPYTPRHGDFITLQELFWVKGMTAEVYEKILPYVTLDSNGQVNLNTASRSVLIALGINPSVCDKIISYRNWHDGLEGTSDDKAFEDLGSAIQVLANNGYLDNNERANLNAVIQSGAVTIKSSNFCVPVLARLPYKEQALRLIAVFNDQGVIKRWEEEFVSLPL